MCGCATVLQCCPQRNRFVGRKSPTLNRAPCAWVAAGNKIGIRVSSLASPCSGGGGSGGRSGDGDEGGADGHGDDGRGGVNNGKDYKLPVRGRSGGRMWRNFTPFLTMLDVVPADSLRERVTSFAVHAGLL
jgi:hypothetical protein